MALAQVPREFCLTRILKSIFFRARALGLVEKQLRRPIEAIRTKRQRIQRHCDRAANRGSPNIRPWRQAHWSGTRQTDRWPPEKKQAGFDVHTIFNTKTRHPLTREGQFI